MKKIDTVIWDFNGTILDDIDLCLFVLNTMLKKRNIPQKSFEEYREIFGFPIKDYYIKAGFNFQKEPFEVLANEFIDLYFKNTEKYNVFKEFYEFEKFLKNKNITQILLSATKEDMLINQLNELKIYNFFNCVIGTSDIYAYGKAERAKEFFKNSNLDFEKALLIGDTLHDFEVAKELNCNCVLCAKGHQSKEKLKNANCYVVDNLLEILNYFFIE